MNLKNQKYILPPCRKCRGMAKLEYNQEVGLFTQSRVRCTVCDTHTDWRPTRFQAEIDWEDMCCA